MDYLNNDERYFDLGTILSITSGYLLTDMDKIYDIVSYITNTEINVYNILYSLRVAEFCILQRYPQLRNVGENIHLSSSTDITDFVNSQKQIFGGSLKVSPISSQNDLEYKPTSR